MIGIPALLIFTALFARPFLAKSAVGTTPLVELLATHASSMKPISVPGISINNFGVVDGYIYRGEQPSGKDYAALTSIGVRTIIDLRDDALSRSSRDAKAAGLNYINIPIDGHGSPTDAQASQFLKDVKDPNLGVIYVHCAGGRHRTGSMIAIYRMAEDGWTADKSYQEMLAYDFYTSGGHRGFKTYVFDYYNRMISNPSSVPVAYSPVVATPATPIRVEAKVIR
jgi:tyrosine-protein phosphatase SIW14